MTEDVVAGLIIGSLTAAIAVYTLFRAVKAYRRARSTARRWARTRLVLTQAPRRRTRGRRR